MAGGRDLERVVVGICVVREILFDSKILRMRPQCLGHRETLIESWKGRVLGVQTNRVVQDIAHCKEARRYSIQLAIASRTRRTAPEPGTFIADVGNFQKGLAWQRVLD